MRSLEDKEFENCEAVLCVCGNEKVKYHVLEKSLVTIRERLNT